MDAAKITFSSANGKQHVVAYEWRPKGDIRGVVQIIHGMREHMGRYTDFAAFLNAKGYAVCGNDHLGHGETACCGGTYGYIDERDGAKHLVRDCRRMTAIIRKKYPGVPVFLLGHSMGSMIGRVYVAQSAEALSGFVCIGTSGGNALAPAGRAVASVLTRLGYGKRTGNLLDKMAFGRYNDRFAGEESRMAWLSSDRTAVDAYDTDIHTQALFTNGGFGDLIDLQLASSGMGWASRVPQELPIFLLSGVEDPVGAHGKGVVQVYNLLEQAGVRDISCRLYAGARHEILNERNREEVYYDIFCWLEEKNT